MPITYDDWRAGQRQKETEKREGREYNRHATIAVAKKAETVLSHEGWQTFLDHLGSLRDTAQQHLDAATKELAIGDVWGDHLTELRARARWLKGEETA